MLLGTKQNLEDYVIKLLSRHSGLSVEKIQKQLQKKKVKATIQGIYRVLRKLQNDGIITKEKLGYSLRIPWILDLSSLADKMQNTYLQQTYNRQLLPQHEQEKHIWYFTNILKMNNFWSQLLLAMAQTTKTGVALSYCPHTWFENLQEHQEDQYRRTYFQKVKQFSVVGSDSFLDTYTVKQREENEDQEESYIAKEKEKIEKDPSFYIDVIDDLVLTIKLDKKSTMFIENLYKKILSEKDLESLDMKKIEKQKARIKVRLEKNKKKAQKYYKKFEILFGPLKK